MADIETRVKEIIMNKLGVDDGQITPEASFTNDLGADSLDTVELVMEFEKAFNLQIPDEDAEKIATVGDAVKYIKAKERPKTLDRMPSGHLLQRAGNTGDRMSTSKSGESWSPGSGRVTPLGNSVDASSGRTCSRERAARHRSRISTPPLYDTHFACEVKNFKATDYLDRKSGQRMDPFAQYRGDLLRHGGCRFRDLRQGKIPTVIGVVYGSGIGGMSTYDTQFKNLHAGRTAANQSVLHPDVDPGHRMRDTSPSSTGSKARTTQRSRPAPQHRTPSATRIRIVQYGDADVMICGGVGGSDHSDGPGRDSTR